MTDLAGLDRQLLERYLADLATDPRAPHSRSRDISSLNAFLDAIRRHHWDHTSPPAPRSTPTTSPNRTSGCRALWPNRSWPRSNSPPTSTGGTTRDSRLLTIILMRCGLRVGDASKVAFDCIVRDGDGAPYLRYTNRKMKREALVPIDEELEAGIPEQQRRILRRWPGSSPWLFPAPQMNPDGRQPLSTHSYRGQLPLARTAATSARDEHGRPVHLTPHQWRHTFGTRLINRDVPQEVVRVLLDHSSGEMTAHYARLHDTTVPPPLGEGPQGQHQGRAVTIDPAGPLRKRPGPSNDSAAPPRRCPTATAACPSRRPAARQQLLL